MGGPKVSPTAAIDQAQKAVRKNLETFYPGMSAAERKLLMDSVGSFTANKDFLEEIRSLQSDRRADAANKLVTPGAPATTTAKPANDLGLPPATGKTRAIDLVPRSAAPAAPSPAAAPVAVFAKEPWSPLRRDIPLAGINVNAQNMPPAPAAANGLVPDAGRQMMEYFQGADPDDPAKAGMFQGFDPKLIQAYRDYRSGEGRRIRY